VDASRFVRGSGRAAHAALLVVLLLAATGCRSAYYSAMESLGQEKRDILVDRVEDARDDQAAAKKQFESALARFKEVTGYDGGDLEDQYDRLDSDYQRCEARAEAVRQRIRSVDEVAGDLFAEWKAEIASMQNASLRRRSDEMRRRTEQRHQALMKSMKRAESRMEPVLIAFRDQVLFLKHNLNARALASLEAQVPEIESDVSVLVRDMEASIRDADAYLAALSEAEAG
jgi:hypothetical protein